MRKLLTHSTTSMCQLPTIFKMSDFIHMNCSIFTNCQISLTHFHQMCGTPFEKYRGSQIKDATLFRFHVKLHEGVDWSHLAQERDQ